jgi:hypothetical protein
VHKLVPLEVTCENRSFSRAHPLLPVKYRTNVLIAQLLLRAIFRLLPSNVDYQSDVYTQGWPIYDERVVWQFWGRAAEAS